MSWRELRKKGNRLYHLAHYAKKARVRKKNIRRLREFEQKYHILTGPISRTIVAGGKWWLNTPCASSAFAIANYGYMQNTALAPKPIMLM